MKIGVKLYPDRFGDAKRLQHEADYIEILARRDMKEDVRALAGLDAPVLVVHNEHLRFGVNISDRARREVNLESVRFAQEAADMFGSKYIILHPGKKDGDSSVRNIIDFYRELGDRRIVTENLAFRSVVGGKTFTGFGRTPQEIGEIMKASGVGLCFDFGHAWAAAFGFGEDQVGFTKAFLNLKPSMFHFYDSVMKNDAETHLNIGDGDADVTFFRSLLPKNAIVSLETDFKSLDKQINDLRFMRGQK
jgi:endonuclease IV